jgi:hypothetical protein
MAKKNMLIIGIEPKKVSDNNPAGVIPVPNYDSDPAKKYGNKFCFSELYADGESPVKGDLNHVTANGVSRSKGQGNNNSYNWWEGNSGIWNKNRDWDGANLTGM